jgi:transcriptional regulator with XRE-family HTH domain
MDLSRTIVGDSMRQILSERLKELRKNHNLTQNQVAVHCNITEKAYQNYELMTREPKLEILIRIADFYGVSLDYLTGRSDTK